MTPSIGEQVACIDSKERYHDYNQGHPANHIDHQTLKIANTDCIALVLGLNILRNHQGLKMNNSKLKSP